MYCISLMDFSGTGNLGYLVHETTQHTVISFVQMIYHSGQHSVHIDMYLCHC